MPDELSLWSISLAAERTLSAAAPWLAGLTAVCALVAARVLWRKAIRRGRRLEAMANAAFEGLMLVRDNHVVAANRALARLMGVGPGWFDHRRVDAVLETATKRFAGMPAECTLIMPDGAHHPVQVVSRTVEGTSEQVLAIRDLAPDRATEALIQRLTRTDLLTGLGNRHALEIVLGKMIPLSDRSGTGFALLRIDLDRFKAINDTLGTAFGDQVLEQAARRLRTILRDADSIARLGSDEFAVVQPLADKAADAAALAERILSELALPFLVDEHAVSISASIGIALYPGDGAAPAEIMNHSALALGQARRDGKGLWRFCEPGMDASLRERADLARDLAAALTRGEFSLAYQPFFDAVTLQVVGCEALLRWAHPERGLVPPSTFIPVAEECGLIVPVSEWVLRNACAEAVHWPQPLVVAVNLSPAQFLQEDVAGRVATVLAATGLDPTRLELEITEGVLMADTDRALETLTALRTLGVRLAMDDFGTGYSSLSYVKKFPFDKLKIDRGFIRDLDTDADAQPIVRAIVALAQSLRLTVTAEGVETERQLAYLRQEGCGFVQGFLLGRPVSADQLRAVTHVAHPGPATVQPPALAAITDA